MQLCGRGATSASLEKLMAAAERSGATRVQHCVFGPRGSAIDATSLSVTAAYLPSVRERSRRWALAQRRTGSFWGLEETGWWQQLPWEQRTWPHCLGGIGTIHDFVLPPVRHHLPGLPRPVQTAPLPWMPSLSNLPSDSPRLPQPATAAGWKLFGQPPALLYRHPLPPCIFIAPPPCFHH